MLKHACAFAVIALGLAALPASAQVKDAIVIDLPNDAATLDPHVQWDTDSYTVYRNIFDNLVTRDPAGKIVPQIADGVALHGRHHDRIHIRTGVTFHDGTPLTRRRRGLQRPRIIDPALQEPAALAVRPDRHRPTAAGPTRS